MYGYKYKLTENTNIDYSIFHREDINSKAMLKPIENSIKRKLETALRPLYCNIINESYMHNVPKGSETHFKVVIVSERFNNQPLIQVIIRRDNVFLN